MNTTLIGYFYYGTECTHDGSPNALIVTRAQGSPRDSTGVHATSVVIYRSDTPTASVAFATKTATYKTNLALIGLVPASDWAGAAITRQQAY